VIRIKDTAYKTWKVLVFYLYTGHVSFHTLRSKETPNEPEQGDAPRCSPKSMYRLAEKMDLSELRGIALKAIESDITEKNIIEELFSEFTSW